MEPAAATVGDVLIAARLRMRKTQAQIAKALGVVQSSVSDWERGRTRPRDLRAVAAAYRVDVRRLLP